jgi:hypothetical protein
MKTKIVTTTAAIEPETKSKLTPDIELITYVSICTKRNDQKNVQKYCTIIHLILILHHH